jgi:hypothetical protein
MDGKIRNFSAQYLTVQTQTISLRYSVQHLACADMDGKIRKISAQYLTAQTQTVSLHYSVTVQLSIRHLAMQTLTICFYLLCSVLNFADADSIYMH